jgi:hypothetical protein
MRKYMPNLVLLAAFAVVAIVGILAFLIAGKLALLFDPAAKESHLSAFMIAIIGVAVAVASAFPIVSRGMPWLTAHLERVWPQRPPEQPIS